MQKLVGKVNSLFKEKKWITVGWLKTGSFKLQWEQLIVQQLKWELYFACLHLHKKISLKVYYIGL